MLFSHSNIAMNQYGINAYNILFIISISAAWRQYDINVYANDFQLNLFVSKPTISSIPISLYSKIYYHLYSMAYIYTHG